MNPYAGNLLESDVAVDQYDDVRLTLASPETIRSWSRGEVKNPETINYRTYRPERDGLFCERIFGPTRDWECACGKYRRIKHKGIVCDRCGVEVTIARVRRERMGHIELSVPVSHIWFLKCAPSRIGLMLDMTANSLERVLYYEDYLVTDPGDTNLKPNQVLTEDEYRSYFAQYGDSFEAQMGASGVQKLLSRIDLDEMRARLEEQIENTRSKQTNKKISKRLKVCEGFRTSGTRPEHMILTVMPVIPPELRPLVQLEGGRFATSDLNDLYRRVINRNNRLRNLLQLKTPDVIIRNEKRMLQEAVDAVFDNGRRGRAVTGAGGRALKSLSDMLKGKTGRFRQNLLGKRVDYSGRSVIICGPELKLWQCGLPKKMALVLFEPFIIRRMKELGLAHTVRSAKKLIERQDDAVWDVLEEVTRGKTVMLNRAPTLHRLSIQSFEPVLVEGEAIKLHPLTCTPFNADFDGDQMAVHVPLSVEAQMESRLLMLSANAIFSPASGKSIKTPTQDIVLGVYYITAEDQRDRMRRENGLPPDPPSERLPLFCDASEVHFAYDEKALGMHSRIRLKNPDCGKDTKNGDKEAKVIETTVGRVFFNEIWPDGIGFVNRKVDKSKLGDLIRDCHDVAGPEETVRMLDDLKDLGYANATLAGASIDLVDMIVPPEKQTIIDAAQSEVDKIRGQRREGIITEGEKHNKVVDVWSGTSEKLVSVMYKAIDQNGWTKEKEERGETKGMEINPVFMMVDSKARGSKQQIRQLAGMRGCMADPSGNIIETPIKSNFREGLSILEYFISTHGARKGLADTALKTADAGYLTRKLVDVSQDVIITEEDCGAPNGIEVFPIMDGEKVVTSLSQRVLGRTSLNDIVDPATGDVIVRANEEIDEAACKRIDPLNLPSLWIRSGLTCQAEHGMCAKCYGRDLATGKPVQIGSAVGIIAAQSIGEPGTQLTMRTFHVGGTASTSVTSTDHVTIAGGTVRFSDDIRAVQKGGDTIILNQGGTITIVGENGVEVDKLSPPLGATVHAKDGDVVPAKFKLAEWDGYATPILSEFAGRVKFNDFVEGISVDREVDPKTGVAQLKAIETKENLHPQVIVMAENTADGKPAALGYYSIPTGAIITVKDGQLVEAGEQLAKTTRKESKTRDITGGLPRVAELFEARQPKEVAEIAKIEGVVDFGDNERGKRVVIVRDEDTDTEERHHIAMGKHIIVYKGDRVRKGQPLTDGSLSPQEILDVSGRDELQRYLVNEVQSVYRLQGVEINDKHIEIIVRQMLRKVKVVNPGDTDFLWGEQVSHEAFMRENEQAMAEGKRPAEAVPVLLGITKASLETDSFISAASFQDTTRVLTDSATQGARDYLRGFKENVILGHLIPAGTGFPLHRCLKLVPLCDPIPEDQMPLSEEEKLRRQAMEAAADEGSAAPEETYVDDSADVLANDEAADAAAADAVDAAVDFADGADE
ncbi:MAG: DNA-directed RNA polymerase subunit beta' [Kiritimatiellae bacterium]|nr:DNA-directed RNA polymerase subunit beta' [Kiritimatiellia bacterium]